MNIEGFLLMNGTGDFWITRWVFQRGLALIYLIAFIGAFNQFRPLIGEHGLLPVRDFIKQVSFTQTPSLFHFFPTDRAFSTIAILGMALSTVALFGFSEQGGLWVSVGIWTALYFLYLSFVNVGQTFYAFGWESILLEAGIYAIFLGSRDVAPPALTIWMLRWLLFRVMFGAGMIKVRGDPCWRDLTCLDYHYETQPMPNPLSWYFHWAPPWTHRAGVLVNHLAELIAPFGYFGPRRIATISGLIAIGFQSLIMASGNLSWLNLLTIVLAIPTLDDAFWARWVPVGEWTPTAPHMGLVSAATVLAVVVGLLSVKPAINMLSPYQVMNQNYNPWHLVGTYGAFGSITRTRDEVVVEGTNEAVVTPATHWRAYEFKGKPGDPTRAPPQIAPYHLRIDWLMWFAAMSSVEEHPWFFHFMGKLLQGDPGVLGLLQTNPFPDQPPRFVRAELYEYRFATPKERRETGLWWTRERVGTYFPTVSLDTPFFRQILIQEGWL